MTKYTQYFKKYMIFSKTCLIEIDFFDIIKHTFEITLKQQQEKRKQKNEKKHLKKRIPKKRKK